MKAISLWQPWATGMALGLKRCETRHWATNHRGLLAIHAAKRIDRDAARELLGRTRWVGDYPAGAVLGVVNLVDCVRMGGAGIDPALVLRQKNGPPFWLPVGPVELAWGNWAPGRFAWVTEPVVWFREPIPLKGHQGLFEWEPPEGWRGMGR